MKLSLWKTCGLGLLAAAMVIGLAALASTPANADPGGTAGLIVTPEGGGGEKLTPIFVSDDKASKLCPGNVTSIDAAIEINEEYAEKRPSVGRMHIELLAPSDGRSVVMYAIAEHDNHFSAYVFAGGCLLASSDGIPIDPYLRNAIGKTKVEIFPLESDS